VFDFSGRFLHALGGFGDGRGSFRGLAGVAAAPRGELVTAERLGARVQRLDAGGQPRADWRLPAVPGAGALAVAVSDSGRVAVADERGGRLWVFDADGHLLAARAGLGGPRALVFEPGGRLIVAEARAARVTRFALVPRGAPPPARQD